MLLNSSGLDIIMKLIGILLIFLSLSSLGFGYARGCIKSQKYLEALLSLLRFIRSQIADYSSPLDKIYLQFENKELDSADFISALRDKGLSYAISDRASALMLPEDISELLLRFSDGLGKSLTGEQLRHCDIYVSLLEEKVKKYEGELNGKCKTAKTLSVSAAAMVALLIL